MFLTTYETAKRLRVHYNSVYAWIRNGTLPAIQVGTQWRVDEDELAEFLEKRRNKKREEKYMDKI